MIVLCRHGRTAANAAQLLQGRLDLPLDAEGQRQVQALVAYVKRAIGTPDLVISSPLLRARQTADAFDTPSRMDDRWSELDYGVWDGTALADVDADTWARWRSDVHFAAPAGETMAELDARVRAACIEVLPEARNQLVVITSHVSPIKAAVAWALGVDIGVSWRCQLDQASVSTIAVTDRGPSLSSFNIVPWR
jgi:broad specificity phosphatase PhoE